MFGWTLSIQGGHSKVWFRWPLFPFSQLPPTESSSNAVCFHPSALRCKELWLPAPGLINSHHSTFTITAAAGPAQCSPASNVVEEAASSATQTQRSTASTRTPASRSPGSSRRTGGWTRLSTGGLEMLRLTDASK